MRRTIRVEIETDESGKYCDKNCPLAIAMGAVCKLEEDDYLDADKTGEIRCPACLAAEYTENMEATTLKDASGREFVLKYKMFISAAEIQPSGKEGICKT
jgi:regulator of RNase E activity RraA